MNDSISKFNYLRFKDKSLFLSVSCSNSLNENLFLDFIANSLNKGISIISFYQNNLSANKFIELAKKIRQLTSFYNSILLIQSRVDIAQIVEADGVTLTDTDIDSCLIKPLVDEHFIIAKYSENNEILMLNNDKSISFKSIKNVDEINKFDEIIKSFHGIMMSDEFLSYENISEALKILKGKNYAR